MTTAHRPTWHAAKGGSEQGGNVLVNPSRAYSSKDMPAHTSLKERAPGQGNLQEQSKVDFRRELLEREAELAGKKRRREPLDQAATALELKDREDEEVFESEGSSEGGELAVENAGAADKRFRGAQAVLEGMPLIENPFE